MILSCFLFALSGCSGDVEEAETIPNNQAEANPTSNIAGKGTWHLITLLHNYYTLKDALVATRAGDADNAANQLAANADSLITLLQADSNSNKTIVPLLDTIKMKVTAMTSMMDEGCEQKRIHFKDISAAMYTILKKTELKNANIYQQYCPMAFNNKGAYWLSSTEEIRNPYFGDKMLECGEITDTLN